MRLSSRHPLQFHRSAAISHTFNFSVLKNGSNIFGIYSAELANTIEPHTVRRQAAATDTMSRPAQAATDTRVILPRTTTARSRISRIIRAHWGLQTGLYLFNDQVKSLRPVVSVIALVDVEEGLEHLVAAVEAKETTADVELILHSQVHPNLQKAYGLKLDSHPGNETNIKRTIALDGKTYEVTGKSTGANLTAIDIDPGKSVKLTFEGSGEVELSLPVTMIEGINMVQTTDGHMIEYTANQTTSATTIIFMLDENMTSIEVMGAMVVPEFPLPLLIVLPAIVATIVVTRTKLLGGK